jgi:hypothetical protein
MNHPSQVMKGVENQTIAQTVGKVGVDLAEALLSRWQQLLGMEQLARFLGAPRELQDALRGHKDEVLADFREADAVSSPTEES